MNRSARMRGFTLPEALVVLAIAGLAIAIAVPATASLRMNGRCAAGARMMAGVFRQLRFQSVALRKNRGAWFHLVDGSWVWHLVEDGNGNGLRTAEIRAGTDVILSGPHRLQDVVHPVRPGFPEGSFPRVPPGSGSLRNLDDPVKFGRSDIVSFSPLGRSSSGTLYLTDGGEHLYAVVLFGPSTRIRIWRFDKKERRWKL
jgi:prepilin-type N-terminal cleavage/methylation domain-containing protein